MLICLAGALSIGCGPTNDPIIDPPALDSHARMLAVLAEIRERTPQESPFVGDAEYRALQTRLKEILPQSAPFDRYRLLSSLSSHALRLGEVQKSIEYARQAEKLLPETKGKLSERETSVAPLLLAISQLRLGENENCLHCRNGENCLLPIQATGIHQKQRGSRGAIAQLLKHLADHPDDLTAIWLLNIASMTVGTYPEGVPEQFRISPDAFDSDEPFPRFPQRSSDYGLDTQNLSGGAVAEDLDHDGDLDIVTSDSDPRGQMRFFRNDGHGHFKDETDLAGLTGLTGGLNLIQADYDNDGHIDLFVLRGGWLGEAGRHPNSLLKNDGTGKFRDVTFEAGLAQVNLPTQTGAWGDFDNDGDLDLYVGNEAFPSQLFLNLGDGTFQDVTAFAGVSNDRFTKGVVWGDFNQDHWQDLYVSNLGEPNRLYLNQCDGTFRDVAGELGVAIPRQSFPAWFWDFDNDGVLDLYVASYVAGVDHVAAEYLGRPHGTEPDRLYRGDGQGGFIDVTKVQGLTGVTQPMGCNFGDLDNDGFLDFYLGTGYPDLEGLMPNRMFHNRRGTSFADVTTAGGFGHLQKGHGVAFADLDDDGDQDVFIELGGAFPGDAFRNALFENPGFGNRWIKIRLIGERTNRSAIGARIRAEIREHGELRSIYRWVNSGGSFGANSLEQHIGLGTAAEVEQLDVFWPVTGKTETFRKVLPNQSYELTEGAAELVMVKSSKTHSSPTTQQSEQQ